MNRRRFLQFSVVGAFSAPGSLGSALQSAPGLGGAYLSKAPIPEAKGPRIVVVGGGWAGLTMAKYLKRVNPRFDVVLLDRNDHFVSFPISNSWLADEVPLDFLTHSYVDAARNHDYLFLRATAVDLDRVGKRLVTTAGSIHYDYLVLAPGIDYDYRKIGVDDPEQEARLRQLYPAGFNSASEILAIKRKLQGFTNGTFVLTVPTGNYRCMAAPYERCCLAAALFKRRKVAAKILLLDMNPGIRIKAEGFGRAFENLYGDVVQYQAGTEIKGIDLDARELSTDFDGYTFDDAIIYPPIRASRLLERMGLHDPASPQKEAHIDRFRYNHVDDESIYVVGDARSQPFSKSGNTAVTEAKYVAEVIHAHAEGGEIPWRSPQTMCFSGVKLDPLEAMSITSDYRFDQQEQRFAFDKVTVNESWSIEGGRHGLAWAKAMFQDLFYQ